MRKFKAHLSKNKPFLIYLVRLGDLLYRKEIVKLLKNRLGESTDVMWKSFEDISVKEFINELRSSQIFGNKKVVVCSDGDLLKKKEIYELVSEAKKGRKAGSSIGVVFFEKASFDTPNFFDITLPTERETKEIIKKFFKKEGIEVDDAFCNFILECTGYDFNKINLELKKILSFAGESKSISIEDVKDLVRFSGEENVFRLVDAFFSGNINECIKIYRNLKALNTNLNFIVSIFQNTVLNLTKIRSLVVEKRIEEREISKAMGINYYVLKKLLPVSKRLNFAVLKKLYIELFEVEKSIKSTSIGGEVAFENFLIGSSKWL